MSLDLTPEQINQLQALGINNLPQHNLVDQTPVLTTTLVPSSPPPQKSTLKSTLPLLSISGLTLISFGGLLMFKSKESTSSLPVVPPESSVQPARRGGNLESAPSPTQVPKSIQHFLLSSQQFFSQALQAQSTSSSTNAVSLLNQSLLAATDAIKEYPSDYRGYQQRGLLYQALVDSQPALLQNALADLTLASQLNPNSAELTHNLALLYSKKGDTNNTINYLIQTVNLEPTKAQNFYDLAKLQQQVGMVPQALDTYIRLLPLVTDPVQKVQVEIEKAALENLLSQHPQSPLSSPEPSAKAAPTLPLVSPDAPTIQADSGQGLIIAAPETQKEITVGGLTDSNSLSGDGLIPTGQKSITLQNSHINSMSKVYLTTTKGGKNQVLQVLSKSDGSAVVGFDTPLNEDVTFKWWIIE